MYGVLSPIQIVDSADSSSDGVSIWYRVDRAGYKIEKLENFTGRLRTTLREAFKINSELTEAAPKLKLFVADSDDIEVDLNAMSDLEDDDGNFNFKELVKDYGIKKHNPLLVKLPGQ
jgi:hypothetical protein